VGEDLKGVVEGRADEGERIPWLVEKMEREEDEAVLVDMERDDSNEKGDPLSSE
jgi:hypothetical protein